MSPRRCSCRHRGGRDCSRIAQDEGRGSKTAKMFLPPSFLRLGWPLSNSVCNKSRIRNPRDPDASEHPRLPPSRLWLSAPRLPLAACSRSPPRTHAPAEPHTHSHNLHRTLLVAHTRRALAHKPQCIAHTTVGVHSQAQHVIRSIVGSHSSTDAETAAAGLRHAPSIQLAPMRPRQVALRLARTPGSCLPSPQPMLVCPEALPAEPSSLPHASSSHPCHARPHGTSEIGTHLASERARHPSRRHTLLKAARARLHTRAPHPPTAALSPATSPAPRPLLS